MPATTLARQFGLTYRVPDEQRAVYQRAFVNLPFVNGDESWELPIPATYIIDRDSTVLYASANEDYTERPEPADIVRFSVRPSGAKAAYGSLRGAEALRLCATHPSARRLLAGSTKVVLFPIRPGGPACSISAFGHLHAFEAGH